MPRLWPVRSDSPGRSLSGTVKSTLQKRLTSHSPNSRTSSAPSATLSRDPSPQPHKPKAGTRTSSNTTVVSEKRPRRIELIIKLGGSALTVKPIPHTLHKARFAACIDTITRLHRRGVGFILMHGAGSFGHFEAHTHRIAEGDAAPLGVSATHAAVAALNAHVVHALIARGVPAVGVSPLLVPAKVRNDFVAALLDRGHLPVLHGDACYAGDGRTAVISADALVASMACAFHFVNRVVFLSDVQGLLRRPPVREPPSADSPLHDGVTMDEEMVRCVVVDETGQFDFQRDVETDVNAQDVTGGIASKVVAAGRCVAETGGRVTAFIAGVGSHAAETVLTGRPDRWGAVECTRICYQLAGSAAVQRVEGDGRLAHAVGGRSRSRTISADEDPPVNPALVESILPKRGSGLGDRARRRAWFV